MLYCFHPTEGSTVIPRSDMIDVDRFSKGMWFTVGLRACSQLDDCSTHHAVQRNIRSTEVMDEVCCSRGEDNSHRQQLLVHRDAPPLSLGIYINLWLTRGQRVCFTPHRVMWDTYCFMLALVVFFILIREKCSFFLNHTQPDRCATIEGITWRAWSGRYPPGEPSTMRSLTRPNVKPVASTSTTVPRVKRRGSQCAMAFLPCVPWSTLALRSAGRLLRPSILCARPSEALAPATKLAKFVKTNAEVCTTNEWIQEEFHLCFFTIGSSLDVYA